jgi:inner membrane protein
VPAFAHAAVGLAAARLHTGRSGPRLAPAAAYVLLATVADADAWARALGAPRGSAWLHRGATHSLVFAVAAAAAVAIAAGGLGRSRVRTLLLGAATAATHGLLDTLTHGGAGVMLLWPWSTARLLAPWRPLAASPMLSRLLTPRGIEVLALEVVLCLPLLWLALRPAGRPPEAARVVGTAR